MKIIMKKKKRSKKSLERDLSARMWRKKERNKEEKRR